MSYEAESEPSVDWLTLCLRNPATQLAAFALHQEEPLSLLILEVQS
jgi:hypothetical protein